MATLVSAVTALKFIKTSSEEGVFSERYLFAAIGNQVHVFIGETEKPSTIEEVFPREYRIHGFSDVVNNRMVIYGGRIVALVCIEFSVNDVRITLQVRTEFNDWVWGIRWLSSGRVVAIACGHSRTYICDSEDLERSFVLQSQEKELTWSTTLFTNTQGLRAVAGSSFGDVLSWTLLDSVQLENIETYLLSNPPKTKLGHDKILPVHRLCAHDGPVMRLAISKDTKRMATASVDRSVRVWQSQNSSCSVCAGGCFTPLLVHYGHLARVWNVSFIENGNVVSVGEDHSCRVWGEKSCMETACYHGHSGRNIWSVSVSDNLIATGGEDGGVKVRSLRTAVTKGPFRLPLFENPRKKGNFRESCRSISVVDSVTIVVTTDFGRILKGGIGDDITWTEIFRDDAGTAFTPCSLAICDDLMLAGQTDGNVVVLRDGVTIGNLAGEGMVMGLFAEYGDEGCDVLISSPNGVLSHWVIGRHNVHVGKYRMERVVKSSLVTAACIIRDKGFVITGDRGGRVMTYTISSRREDDVIYPVFMIRPHKDRVSSLQYANKNLYTSGFDGAVITYDMTNGGSMSVKCVKSAPDRTDTITKLRNGEILAFRGSECVLWGLDEMSEYMRCDMGNWRRAHDINFESCVMGYWRGGGVYITSGKPCIWGSSGGHGGRVCGIATVGLFVITTGEDGVLVWRGGRVVQRLGGHSSVVHGVTTVDGGVVTVGGKDEVFFWELINECWRRKKRFVIGEYVDGDIVERCLSVARYDTHGVVVGRSDGSIVRVCDDGCEVLSKVSGGALCMDCYEGVMVVGDTGGVVSVFESGCVENIRAHQGGVNAIKIIPNGLVTAGDDGCVKAYTKTNGAWRLAWCGIRHTAAVTGVALSSKGVYSVGADQRVVRWTSRGDGEVTKTAIVDASSIVLAGNKEEYVIIGGTGVQWLDICR